MQLAKLKRSVILLLIAMMVLGNSSCSTPKIENPPEIWATDAQTQQIFRRLEGGQYQQCRTQDPCFDDYKCSPTSQLIRAEKQWIDLMKKCKKWEK